MFAYVGRQQPFQFSGDLRGVFRALRGGTPRPGVQSAVRALASAEREVYVQVHSSFSGRLRILNILQGLGAGEERDHFALHISEVLEPDAWVEHYE